MLTSKCYLNMQVSASLKNSLTPLNKLFVYFLFIIRKQENESITLRQSSESWLTEIYPVLENLP